MKRLFTTTVCLNLDDEDDRRAFEHLQRLDKRQYRSYSKATVAAINACFDRQERLAADPYLETREKEDAFLEKIEQTIRSSQQGCAPLGLTACCNSYKAHSPQPLLLPRQTRRIFLRHWTLQTAFNTTTAPLGIEPIPDRSGCAITFLSGKSLLAVQVYCADPCVQCMRQISLVLFPFLCYNIHGD